MLNLIFQALDLLAHVQEKARGVCDEHYKVLGYEIHVRVESPAFRAEEHRIAVLIDDEMLDEAKEALRLARERWPGDASWVRMGTLIGFLES